MGTALTITQWGNTQWMRLPLEVLEMADVGTNDTLFIEVDSDKRIVISKKPSHEINTLEELFKDYDGCSFKTDIIDLGSPVGEEKW